MDRLQKMVTYRNRAELLRAMAGDFEDMGHQHMLNGLARDYDRMADELAVEMSAEIDARRKAIIAQNSN